MRPFFAASLATAVIACGAPSDVIMVTDGGSVVARDGGAVAAVDAGRDAIVLTGTPILATAPLGSSEALLGTTVDLNFNQVNADVVFHARTDGSTVAHISSSAFQFGWVQALTSKELAANVKGWGLTSAALEASNTTRYMSMRANQVDYFEEVDLTRPGTAAPNSAVYFVSKLYYGHSYEALFQADQTTLTASVAADLKASSGSINAKATQYNLQESNVGRGLAPKSGDAIFAASAADVMKNYSATAEAAVPIFIEYRLVPGAVETPGTSIAWASSIKPTIHIDEVDIFHNGAYLDASNTKWAISVTCKLNGATAVLNDAVWSQSSVTAGGSTVTTAANTPQDPNTANPTSTYGRYAGLTWSRTVPAAAGNVLECALGGQRLDTSTPVDLPPVAISVTIDSVATSGFAGNYDTGNRLDYLVHYSVTY